MSKQTIDGVPRELLPCPLCGSDKVSLAWDVFDTDRGRRTQSQITCLGCRLLTKTFKSHAEARAYWNNRAAQPQGDTVPVSAHWSDWSMVTLEIEGQHRTYVEYGEPKAKPVAWQTGSITWAYEPDARRHGERHGVLVKPLFDRPLYAAQPQGEPVAYQVVTGFRRRFTRCKISAADCAKHLSENGEKDVRIEPLYAEQPAPVAVVLPQRKHVPDFTLHPMLNKEYTGWNAYDAEFRRLNPWLANDK